MKLRKRLKKPHKNLIKRIKSPKKLIHKKLTGYGARTDPICTKCKRHKPLNWWVKDCANICCTGHYKSPKRKMLKK